MSTISDNLKYIRLIRGYTLTNVGKLLGKTPNTISNWENGKASPPIEDALQLCEIYGITIDQLVGFEPCPEIEDFIRDQKITLNALDELYRDKKDIEKKIQFFTAQLNRGSN